MSLYQFSSLNIRIRISSRTTCVYLRSLRINHICHPRLILCSISLIEPPSTMSHNSANAGMRVVLLSRLHAKKFVPHRGHCRTRQRSPFEYSFEAQFKYTSLHCWLVRSNTHSRLEMSSRLLCFKLSYYHWHLIIVSCQCQQLRGFTQGLSHSYPSANFKLPLFVP